MNDKTIPLAKNKSTLNEQKMRQDNEWREDLDYRALFEQTEECVFIISLDLYYIAANQQALSLLGYEEHELIGMPVSDIMSLDEELGKGIVVDQDYNLRERILKRKDNSSIPVEISTSVVTNKNGEPAYIQSIARDISERKNSEQILKQHAGMLSVISDAAARLFSSSNFEARIPEVLKSLGQVIEVSYCAIFEINTFSKTATIQIQHEWKLKQVSSFDIRAVVEPLIAAVLNEKDGLFIPNSDIQNNLSLAIIPVQEALGSWVFLGLFDENNARTWLPSEQSAIKTAADLIGAALQRNQYEETIRLNEARNRAIVDALPDLLIRIDKNGLILDYSAAPEHPLFLQRDMISGKNLSETWPEEIVEQIIGEDNKKSFVSSNRVDGFYLPYSNSAYESRLHPINASEALIVIRDITEQAELDQMKSDFINRASHELRTPLTTAILMTELLQEGGTKDEVDEYWHILVGELNRQKILIDRLLLAGRLESGMMRLEKAPLDVIPILEESILAIKPIAKKSNVAIKLSSSNKSIFVFGDKSGLQQVFINLINNAAKFSPEGGTISVDVKKHDGFVQIAITDQGFGIPPEALPHLFERFYRAKNVTVAEIPGSGVGLYIVKSIIEELDGTIRVDSVLNEGTTITVALKQNEMA